MNDRDTAIILAGGKSTRMGFDKQFIKIDGRFITDYIIEMLQPVFESIILVTNRPEFYSGKQVTIVEDYYKDFGPLGGIHAGLAKSQSRYNYMIACDMPYINTAYINYMRGLIEKDCHKSEAAITRFGDWIEPFNAFYSKDLIPRIESNIAVGKRKISDVLALSRVLYVDEQATRAFSPDWTMFANLNEAEDLKKYGFGKTSKNPEV